MNTPKRGLGKGLDALLATSAKAQARVDMNVERQEAVNHSELQQLPLAVLRPGMYQPRQEMEPEALDELAESIRAQGVIQPLVVRRVDAQQYEIIAGERRWRASKKAGLTHVPCLVRELNDKAASAIALIENIQREDLNAMEEAEALNRLVQDFSLTHQQLAEALGKSRTTISNLLRLNGLEAGVKKLLFGRQLEMGHARALLSLEGESQIEAAVLAVNKKFTVRQIEALVKKMQAPDVESAANQPSPQILEVQDRLADKLGTKVTLSQSQSGSGKLVISFDQNEKLMQILAILDRKV
ncbi:ParB/RepB/Spo0J family partition protein [Enterovibrio norvegicus]|uniref:Probable chromosome-partitioning protein ParB n=2 Tax=Enterovibrio norvegicus TaxID=188144 RepID=A0A1I5QJH4_9GAMM|nr:ParB/RepB/Spo0J family partition protein [Enterovibrio norvegicus]OEF57552.1 chromosome partitioning protein ParB [Enterovibrio norvegicus]SFP46247.1 chromosome partitioning protein, ParB family [Enterovibrio norvegicus DSM 15893]